MSPAARLALVAAAALALGGCDQLTKHHAASELSAESTAADGRTQRVPARVTEVVPGYWELHYRENPGAAFSVMRDVAPGVRIPFFVGVTLLGLALLGALVYRHAGPWTAASAALIAGGALGNLVDRVRYGHVVDFIHWHVRDVLDYPTFNVADVWIFLGGLLLLVATFRPAPAAT
ncbi:MAG: signal peptidase II [Polyangiales bacterium]